MQIRETTSVNEDVEEDDRIIDALRIVMESHDSEAGKRIQRIKGYIQILLSYVSQGYPEYGLTNERIKKILRASELQDIGRIAIPGNILLKVDKLTNDEFEIMKMHTIKGCDIINAISYMKDRELFQYCYEICRYHHERYDGKGYPDKLEGENIPIAAQVVSLADAYDALVSNHAYKAAFSPEQAIHMILNGECGMFSAKLLECFCRAEDDLKDYSWSLV
jgi:putative two-component system response regulator